MKEEKVFIPADTIELEGLVMIQEAHSVHGGVVLCHPHPQYGGDMHNTVIKKAVSVASREGFSTLRFNFRGVGGSGGFYGDGIGEREDVKAAIDYLHSRQGRPQLPFILLGYSFGAWAGLPVGLDDSRIIGVVAIAPPLEMYDFGFLKKSEKRKLILAGSRDHFCPSTLLKKWYQDLEEPKSLTVIEGADHFFFYHADYLIDPLREFLQVISQVQP